MYKKNLTKIILPLLLITMQNVYSNSYAIGFIHAGNAGGLSLIGAEPMKIGKFSSGSE